MTEAALSEKFLKSAICELTEVTRTSQGFEISLPQAYATGNVVTVIVRSDAGGFLIHDNSHAAMLLSRSGTSRLSPLIVNVRDAVAHYGCEIEDMRVYRRCASLDEVALSAILVGCASRLVADQVLQVEKAPMFDFKSKLLGRVTDIVGDARVKTNRPVIGHLGSRYKIAATVLSADEKKPLAFVEPLSEPSAIARKFKEFYDISLNSDYATIERIAVLDDSKEFPSGDTLLMQEVSTLIRYSDTANLFAQWATVQ